MFLSSKGLLRLSFLEDMMTGLKAKDLMRSEILTVNPDWSIDQLADFFVENSISGGPVTTREDKLIGVVSLTDIVRHSSMPGRDLPREDTSDYYLYGLEPQYSPQELKTFHIENETETRVRDIMTHVIFEVNEDTSIKQVADAMIRGRIHRVFVTKEKKLVGIISALDMLGIIRDM